MNQRFFALLLLLTILTSPAGQSPGYGSRFNFPANMATTPVQESFPPMLVAIGGGYTNLDSGFLPAVIQRTVGSTVKILILPIAYATDPDAISHTERANNILDAEVRRSQIEQACRQQIPAGKTCSVVLASVFVRNDALSSPIPEFFPNDLAGVFILGGDQTVAMRVIANTPLEKALEQAYRRGVVIGGTSAGAAVQSITMVGGYQPEADPFTSLQFGTVDLWLPPDRRGLSFGISSAIIDQHFYQRGRFARLLNTISLPQAPHLGIGVDAYTGVQILDGRRLEAVFGSYTATVLDAATYHAAEGVQYRGRQNFVSLRNVLLHLLPPGAAGFDLETRNFAENVADRRVDRSLEALNVPAGAGPLYISGGLNDSLAGSTIINEFVNAGGGQQARVLIVALAFADRRAAQQTAGRYQQALGVNSQVKILAATSPALTDIPAGITAILLIGQDQSLLNPDAIPAVRQAWLAGTPVLADGAAAALIGSHFAARGPTPLDENLAESFAQGAFIQGNGEIRPGLGFVEAMIEPRVLVGNRWGTWFSLAYQNPAVPAMGIAERAALEIRPGSAQVIGDNGVFILDLSRADLALGKNQAYGAINGFLDVFAPGDAVAYQTADQSFMPIRRATPMLASPTQPPSTTATSAPTLAPTRIAPTPSEPPPARTPRATPTRMILYTEDGETPPPAPTDPGLLRSMIGLGIAMFFTIIIGLWINRSRFNLR